MLCGMKKHVQPNADNYKMTTILSKSSKVKTVKCLAKILEIKTHGNKSTWQ